MPGPRHVRAWCEWRGRGPGGTARLAAPPRAARRDDRTQHRVGYLARRPAVRPATQRGAQHEHPLEAHLGGGLDRLPSAAEARRARRLRLAASATLDSRPRRWPHAASLRPLPPGGARRSAPAATARSRDRHRARPARQVSWRAQEGQRPWLVPRLVATPPRYVPQTKHSVRMRHLLRSRLAPGRGFAIGANPDPVGSVSVGQGRTDGDSSDVGVSPMGIPPRSREAPARSRGSRSHAPRHRAAARAPAPPLAFSGLLGPSPPRAAVCHLHTR